MNPDVVYVSGKACVRDVPTFPFRFVNLTPTPVKVLGYVFLDTHDWMVRIVSIPVGESIIISAEVGQQFFFANSKNRPIIFKSASNADDSGYVLRVTRENTSSAAGTQRSFFVTTQFEATPLKDLCKAFTIKSVRRSIPKIEQLPLPDFMIVQLMEEVETPSDFVRAEKIINEWID